CLGPGLCVRTRWWSLTHLALHDRTPWLSRIYPAASKKGLKNQRQADQARPVFAFFFVIGHADVSQSGRLVAGVFQYGRGAAGAPNGLTRDLSREHYQISHPIRS